MESQLWSTLVFLTRVDNERDLFSETHTALGKIFPGIELTYNKIHVRRKNTHKKDNIELNKRVLILISDYFDEKPNPKPLSGDQFLNKCFHENKVIKQDLPDKNKVMYALPLGYEKEIQFLLKITFPGFEAPPYLLSFLDIFINYYKVIRSNERDFLTGMYNRRAFNRVMSTLEIHPHTIHERKSDYLVIIDIDFFKAVNDNFGHMIGDEVLILFSRVIREKIRTVDIAFRTGGEEFVFVLFDLSFENAVIACERLRSTIENTVFPQVHKLTLSGGFTKLEYPLDTYYALKKADAALYYAKDHGRNQVCCYEDLVKTKKIPPVAHFKESIDVW
ncbi:MAG: GGDEF domain-containing protein [Spirochaetia bacterium]|nr:GGDEF domain-containing protein [Spirochaetia bacterium]